jgi:dTDP-4-dehydrorhamnose reductase
MSDLRSILLFGANGQLGARLHAACTARGYDVTALDRSACDFETADAKRIDIALRAVEPQLVINAAAYTAVDKAQSQPELAHHINADVPAWIARAAKAYGVPCIHFSTDYVFDGVRGRYAEDAPTHPLNVYGASKLAGEEAVRMEGGYVFRLQWVYDTRGQNFLLTMKKLLPEREEVRVIADQLGAPTAARDIAAALCDALPLMMRGDLPPAIYHLAAGGYTSWHGFACAIAQTMGVATHILPITSAEYPLPAIRPLDGRLNTEALAAHGITVPHWRDGLNALLQENEG